MTTQEMLFLSIGSIGAVFMLAAFVLETKGVFKGATRGYELLNFLGSFLLFIYTFSVGAYPNMVLNFIWACIALMALWRLAGTSRNTTKKRPRGH